MRNRVKLTGLFYKKNGPVNKYQQGGLAMGYGYKDPNKDMYRNIGDSAIFKNGVSGAESGAFAGAQSIKGSTFSKQVKAPPNSSFSGNLLYKPTKGVQFTGITPPATKGMDLGQPSHIPAAEMKQPTVSAKPQGKGLSPGAAGAINSVAQAGLGMLGDNDPTTYTTGETIKDIGSSTLNMATAGLTVGGPIGAAVGGAVGLAMGIFQSSKKKKEAKKAKQRKSNSLLARRIGQAKQDIARTDQNIASTASSMYTQRPAGVPGGYLNS